MLKSCDSWALQSFICDILFHRNYDYLILARVLLGSDSNGQFFEVVHIARYALTNGVTSVISLFEMLSKA